MLKTVVALLLLSISFAVGGVLWSQEKPNIVSNSAPKQRYHHGFAAVGNISVLVAGYDFDNGGAFLPDTWTYNAVAKTWTLQSASTAALTRAYFSLNTHGQEVVLFGGAGVDEVNYNDLWRYSIASNTWTQDTYSGLSPGDATTLARQFHAADIIGDTLYVFGGFSYAFNHASNDLWSYNLNTKVWTKILADGQTSGPLGRQGHSLNAFHDPVVGPSLIVFGGYQNTPQTGGFPDAWQYQINNNVWVQLSSTNAPAGRYSHDSGLVGNKLYIFGGIQTQNIGTPPTTDVYFGDVWSLTLNGGALSTWATEIADNNSDPAKRQGHRSALVNGVIFSSGGYRQFVGLQNDVWSLR